MTVDHSLQRKQFWPCGFSVWKLSWLNCLSYLISSATFGESDELVWPSRDVLYSWWPWMTSGISWSCWVILGENKPRIPGCMLIWRRELGLPDFDYSHIQRENMSCLAPLSCKCIIFVLLDCPNPSNYELSTQSLGRNKTSSWLHAKSMSKDPKQTI